MFENIDRKSVQLNPTAGKKEKLIQLLAPTNTEDNMSV